MGAPKWPPIPPTLRAPAEPWRFASVANKYGARQGPHTPTLREQGPHPSVAEDYASWTKREDGGRAVVVEEAGVG